MNWRIGIAAILSVAVMVWLAAISEDWKEAFPLKGQKGDYYNLLVDGFQAGHLYMKADVHPGRMSPDVQVRMRSPYLLDASQYHGRYYLYFGVVPALAVFWPYAALTGHDCPQNLAVLIAVVAGLLISIRLYSEVRARYFPTARAWVDFIAVGLLAFTSGSPVLLVSGGMYEVALSWGYLWISLLTWCLYRALHADRLAAVWLAAASLAYGLGVGSRPTIFLLGPLLPLSALVVAQRGPLQDRARCLWRLAAAVVVPAGVIGAGLMAYNYARFDNPLEFGLNYQVNAIAGNGHPLQSAAFVGANLRWYYFTPPTVSAFFPYLFPHSNYPAPAGYYVGSESTHGQFLTILLATACAFAVLGRKPPFPRRLGWFAVLLALSFLVMLLVTSTFAYRSTRYLVDFQPQLLLLLVLATGVSWGAADSLRPLQRVGSAVIFLTGTVAGLAGLFTGFQFLDRFAATHPAAYRSLSFYGNYPAAWVARLGWHEYGPLRFKVVFNRPPTPVYEALVSTGAPNYKDVLFAAQYPNGYVDFTVYHEGYGGARSKLIPVEYGRPYEIELDMGSLYPPVASVYFPRWESQPREILKNFTRVVFDGNTVIKTRQFFYDSSPGLLSFGQAPGRPEHPFSGRITGIERLPMLNPTELKAIAESGIWQLGIELPPPSNLLGQPILSSGVTGKGNLLFLQNLPDGTFRFGIDFWGIGARFSPPLARTEIHLHLMEIFVTPQIARIGPRLFPDLDLAALRAAPPRLQLWLDGRLIWTTELIAHTDTYDFTGVGTNTQGFSTAESAYSGILHPLLLSSKDARALVEKNLRPPSP